MVERTQEIISEDPSILETTYAYDIVKNSKVVVFEWTLDINIPTKYVSSNIDQFGYSPEDFYSGPLKDFWMFVHPEDRERVRNEVYEARKIGETFNHNYRILTDAGEVRWIEERILYEKEDDKLISEKGIVFDITERKLLEEALEKSKERYQRIFENSSVIIFTMSLEGHVSAINKMFERTLGYGHYFVGHHISELLVHMDDASLFLSLGKEAFDESFDVDVWCSNSTIKTLNVSTNIIDSIGEEIEIVAVDVSEKKKDEQKIRYLSFHDKLTNVYNRAYFDDIVEALDKDQRYPFSIIIGDMNGLKDLNDHYGHKRGDMLLKSMAEICVASCRESDVVCRIGGDEFAIICPDTNEKGAASICDRVRQLCSETIVEHIGHPSIALGYSTKESVDTSIDQIFKMADNNMYRNKMTYSESSSGMYLKALQLTLEKSRYESKTHMELVKHYALILGEAIGLPPSELDDLGVVAQLHDIGKIGVPDEILHKSGSLTEEEFELIKGHSYFGYSMVKATPSTIKIADYILYHHEWYDGSGYPEGIKGEDIPLISRIIAITDAYAVMLHDTPYRNALTKDEAINELNVGSHSQFDPYLVETFLNIIGE